MKNCLKSSLSSKAAGASLNVLTFHLMSPVGHRIQVHGFYRFNSEPLAVTLVSDGQLGAKSQGRILLQVSPLFKMSSSTRQCLPQAEFFTSEFTQNLSPCLIAT